MSRSFCLRKWVVGVVMVISQVEMCESQLYTIRRIADESKPACETVRIRFRVIRRLKDSTALNFSLVRVITSRHIYTSMRTYDPKCSLQTDWCGLCEYKKLSYRRETARHLPTWRTGARPSSPLPSAPSGYTYAYGRIRNPQQTYVKRTLR